MLSARLAAALGALALPAILAAQQPYDASIATAMSGTWVIDLERSEPVPGPAVAGAPRGNPAAAVGGAPTSGGGSRRGGGGAGGGAPPSSAGAGFGRAARGGSGLGNPHVRELMTQLRVPEVMTFTAGESLVTISVQEVEVTWTPDGRKHQQAQMDGTLLQNTARWKGDKVELIDGVEGAAELKREIRLIDDGRALEVKLQLSGPSIPGKVSRKVVYTRQ